MSLLCKYCSWVFAGFVRRFLQGCDKSIWTHMLTWFLSTPTCLGVFSVVCRKGYHHVDSAVSLKKMRSKFGVPIACNFMRNLIWVIICNIPWWVWLLQYLWEGLCKLEMINPVLKVNYFGIDGKGEKHAWTNWYNEFRSKETCVRICGLIAGWPEFGYQIGHALIRPNPIFSQLRQCMTDSCETIDGIDIYVTSISLLS